MSLTMIQRTGQDSLAFAVWFGRPHAHHFLIQCGVQRGPWYPPPRSVIRTLQSMEQLLGLYRIILEGPNVPYYYPSGQGSNQRRLGQI